MMIIGCDYHPSWQQISWVDTETGETGERKLVHASGEAKMFYQQLAAPVLIGMEATGNSQWFVELVEDIGHEIWVGELPKLQLFGREDEEGWVTWGKQLNAASAAAGPN
jgi:N6-adenosine-specific RNA methylase IME4